MVIISRSATFCDIDISIFSSTSSLTWPVSFQRRGKKNSQQNLNECLKIRMLINITTKTKIAIGKRDNSREDTRRKRGRAKKEKRVIEEAQGGGWNFYAGYAWFPSRYIFAYPAINAAVCTRTVPPLFYRSGTIIPNICAECILTLSLPVI